jgi:two-component system sensor histidine kinase DesK
MSRLAEEYQRRGWNLLWLPLSIVWLTLLVSPTVETVRAQRTPIGRILVIASVASFVLVYLWMGRRNAMRRPGPWRVRLEPWLPIATLTALCATMNVAYGHEWSGLFTFAAAAAGIYLFPPAVAVRGVAVEIVLAVLVGRGVGDPWSEIGSTAFMSGAVGLTMSLLVGVGVANRELRAAREELARLAVTEERLRFARDLHDLLGHSLSLIALKSELAGRLVEIAPERAVAEINDVEAVARQALAEVREAVAGYRQPTLADELRGAAEILAAAGITLTEKTDPIVVPAPVEAALAWTVREGVTNVIRHSRARRCTIRVQRAGGVEVEISDDGQERNEVRASNVAFGGAGNGLTGLAERVKALGGWFAAGPQPDGGFRLAVWVPAEDIPYSQPHARLDGEVPAADSPAVAQVSAPLPRGGRRTGNRRRRGVEGDGQTPAFAGSER